jgi:type IV secretory pathway TraG/TraD family ATPase VirD4
MGQKVHVLDLRDDGNAGSLNPLDLAARGGTDPAAIARSFAAELIQRGVDERDRFWNDWSETLITGGTAWLLADCPPEDRRLSALFDLFTNDDPVYNIATLLEAGKSPPQGRQSGIHFLPATSRFTDPPECSGLRADTPETVRQRSHSQTHGP